MDYVRWNLKLAALCQNTMTSKTTAPYLQLHQNDILRIPTYHTEMEPAIFIIHSQAECHKIQETSNTRLTSCPAHFENGGNLGLKQNTTDPIYCDHSTDY
jgi:hypothetical protein